MEASRLIIFCQAPADVLFVLSLYEEKQKTSSVSIVVVNVEGIYKFLDSLKLNLEQLIFIPYAGTSLKKLKDIYLERKRINFLFKKYFAEIKSAEVCFFSRFEDWLTSTFIHKLSKFDGVKIKYLRHHDDASNFDEKSSISIRLRIYCLILKYVTGVNFKVKILEKLPEFRVNDYTIQSEKAILNKDVLKKYAYKDAAIDKQKANVLFFISDCQDSIFESKYYNDTVLGIISVLQQNGYCVVLKGHPRIGLSHVFKHAADAEVPGYIPGEFIDADSIRICIGIDTNAVSYFAKYEILPTYSIIKMVPAVNDRQIEIIIEYLKNQSDNKLQFINDEEQLIEALKNHLYAKQ